MRLVHYRYKPEFAASAGIEATAPETGRNVPVSLSSGRSVLSPGTCVSICLSPADSACPVTHFFLNSTYSPVLNFSIQVVLSSFGSHRTSSSIHVFYDPVSQR